MLEHPWLNMPDDYDCKMSDLEFQKYNLLQQTRLQEEEEEKRQQDSKSMDFFEDRGIGELVLEDDELAEADDEDNVSLDLDQSDDSISLTGKKSNDGSDNDPEFQTNISFSGGYVPNTDLSRVDKGQGNPQFKGLLIKA